MLKALARLALVRVLPRRILPIVTVVEILLFVRAVRKRSTVRVSEPAHARHGPPPTRPAAASGKRGGTAPSDPSATDPG